MIESAETSGVGTGWSAPAIGRQTANSQPIEPGTDLAGRYEILEMLGRGGMGAVFKARDRELDRLVAIKVIRPELADDPEILHRFKQELILARQVTHRNVIRIFDLGQSDGTKFITMEYVEGTDLKRILAQRGKLPPEEAAAVIQQICQALDAAHTEGVIHRDLKPQNIMVDGNGKIVVMDFGIARSLDTSGATQTGAILGTPDYMSPEQARAEKIDPRSDLFALGIIFYELLTGKFPYKADTAMGTLLKRIQERATPPMELDDSIPRALSDIVVKCLAADREQRYQSAREVLHDVEARSVARPAEAPAKQPGPAARQGRRKWLAISLGFFVLAIAAFFIVRSSLAPAPVADAKPVTILIEDFENTTADPVFDGTLESALTLAMEGAPFITSYRRGDARKVAAQLNPGATRLDDPLAKLVARREGINVVISGSIAPQGAGFRISLKAVDAATDSVIAAGQVDSKSKDDVLSSIGKLAAPLRKGLGDATPESLQLMAVETFSAGNIQSAHEYALAQEFQWAGKGEEAIAAYHKAIDLDPNLGRAYAGLAAVNANLGHTQEAEQYYKKAMSLIDRMSGREKYRTLGGYYLFARNPDKAIEQLSEMVQKYPSDSSGFSNLAYAYSLRRDFTHALEIGRQAVQIYPKNLIQRNNVAIYAMYAGDFATAASEAEAVLNLNPAFLKAHVVVALSDLAQGRAEQAADQYRKLETVSALGASFAATGMADLEMYRGRPSDAAAILEKQADVDIQAHAVSAAATKLVLLAEAALQTGNKTKALSAAEKAGRLSNADTLAFQLGRFYVQAGQDAKARAIAADLQARLLDEPQAYGKLIESELLLKKGNSTEAARLALEAKKLADTWIGRLDLGCAYLASGQYTEAHSELELCLTRRGEATAIFLDEVPTYRYFPPLYYCLGLAHDGLRSPDAVESYRSFLAIRKDAVNDPLVAEAQRLLGTR